MIISFKSIVLEKIWTTGDMTLLPGTYAGQVVEILDYLHAATTITDLELLGGFVIRQFQPDNWAVTVTVNNVEPIGSVTCYYIDGSAHNVDLNEYD